MDRVVSIPWLDEGKEIFVSGVPVNGHREIQKAKAKQSSAITAILNSQTLSIHLTALRTRSLLEKKGAEKAREAWLHTLKLHGWMAKGLDWEPEDFEASLTSFIDDVIYKQHDAETDEEAEESIASKTKAIEEEWDVVSEAFQLSTLDYSTLEAYWLIRASDATNVTPHGLPPVRFDRSNDAKADMLQLIGDNLRETDLQLLNGRGAKPEEAEEEEGGELLDASVVRGKSSPTSSRSTKSSGASTRSSAPATATTKKSAKSEASSG